MKSSSRSSLVPILPCEHDHTRKSRSKHVRFLSAFLCEIELTLQSCTHFVGLIFPKCCGRDSFLTFSCGNRALATVLCTFVGNFPRSSRKTAETETLLRRPRTATLPKKTQGFAHLNSRVPDLLHTPTMMMRLWVP